MAALIGLPSPAILIRMGLGVIGYAAFLFRAIWLDSVPRPLAVTTVVADSVWVVSVALLIANWVPFTSEGKWIIAITADIVGLFALFQFIGLRQRRHHLYLCTGHIPARRAMRRAFVIGIVSLRKERL